MPRIALIVFICASVLSSCTSIDVHGNAKVNRSHWFAPVKISFERSDTIVAVASEGIGIVPSVNGAVLGYLKETTFIANDPTACNAVIILNGKDAVGEFTEFLKSSQISLNNICIFNTGVQHETK